MPPRKDDAPSVATYADHEVITPPHALRKVLSAAAPAGNDVIARAEAALDALSSEFSTWMRDESDRLESARQTVRRNGLREKPFRELFRVAHDIKGEAVTFGYPEVATIAESLCRLMEHTPSQDRVPLALVDQHVDAVRAIVREHARPGAGKLAVALAQRLREVTDEFLKRENSFRPDYLDTIFAPPLAPVPPTALPESSSPPA